MNQFLFLILGMCFCANGCTTSKKPQTLKNSPYNLRDLNLVVEIPVVRPSTRDAAQLAAEAANLVRRHKINNAVASLDANSVPRSNGIPVTDEAWRNEFRLDRLLENNGGWNYDARTTAQVYLGRRRGEGSPVTGKVFFVNDGDILGFKVIGGRQTLYRYYRDMKNLGIYIP